MQYNLKNSIEINKALAKLQYAIDNEQLIELKQVRKKRTIKQNAYLHVLISLYAIEFGYTLEEAKTILKRLCNFMTYEKNGQKFLRATRDFKTDELTSFIDWIRDHAGQNGLYLPTPDEYILNQIEINKELELHKNYL